MPSEWYTHRRNGTLLWRWEEGYNTNMEVKKMPENFNRTIGRKCRYCGKKLNDRVYWIGLKLRKVYTCSACKCLFDTIKREIKEGRELPLKKLLVDIVGTIRHCTACKYFRIERPYTCRAGNSTGVGRHMSSYPRSYANHGCSRFMWVR